MANSRTRRRSFLTQLGAGMTVAGAGLTLGATAAPAQAATAGFSAARHPEDAWMDSVPGSHRLVIDTTTPHGRLMVTILAGLDAIWAKYGKLLPPFAAMDDPKTNQRPAFNLLNTPGYGLTLPNFGTTIDDLTKRGVHVAVCQRATSFFAGMFAKASGSTDSAVYAELTGNMVDNSHLAAAGIVAVNRAQEHGYTLASAG